VRRRGGEGAKGEWASRRRERGRMEGLELQHVGGTAGKGIPLGPPFEGKGGQQTR